MIKNALFLTVILMLSGCGDPQTPKRLPAEKFFRGNMVKLKIDNRLGVVINKKYVNNDSVAHDVWAYEIRIVTTGKNLYSTMWAYEFEIEPASAEKP